MFYTATSLGLSPHVTLLETCPLPDHEARCGFVALQVNFSSLLPLIDRKRLNSPVAC